MEMANEVNEPFGLTLRLGVVAVAHVPLHRGSRAGLDGAVEVDEHPAISHDDGVPRQRVESRAPKGATIIVEDAAVTVALETLLVPRHGATEVRADQADGVETGVVSDDEHVVVESDLTANVHVGDAAHASNAARESRSWRREHHRRSSRESGCSSTSGQEREEQPAPRHIVIVSRHLQLI
jgi:hypothetical protein